MSVPPLAAAALISMLLAYILVAILTHGRLAGVYSDGVTTAQRPAKASLFHVSDTYAPLFSVYTDAPVSPAPTLRPTWSPTHGRAISWCVRGSANASL